MDHQDGRCATDAETVVVQGTALQSAIDKAVLEGRSLVVVKNSTGAGDFKGPGKLSIVGVGKPVIGGGPGTTGLVITGGELYLRDVTVAASAGGVLIDGGGFTLKNVVVRNNEKATTDLVKWGGIYVKSRVGPGVLKNVQILNNLFSGLVCAAPITLDNVEATGNVGEDIAAECR